MEPLDFVLELKEVPVIIDGEQYVLVQFDGRQRDKYLNTTNARLVFDKDGKPKKIRDFQGMHAELIAASLWKVCQDGRKAVDIDTIQTWPSDMIDILFDTAQKLSRLNIKKEDEKSGEAQTGEEEEND